MRGARTLKNLHLIRLSRVDPEVAGFGGSGWSAHRASIKLCCGFVHKVAVNIVQRVLDIVKLEYALSLQHGVDRRKWSDPWLIRVADSLRTASTTLSV